MGELRAVIREVMAVGNAARQRCTSGTSAKLNTKYSRNTHSTLLGAQISHGGCEMKENVMLTLSSLASIVLTTFHLAGDYALGIEKTGKAIFIVVPIAVVFLYGTVVLAERWPRYIVILLGSLLGLYAVYIHAQSARIGQVAVGGGGFFFIWVLIALGVTSLFSVILSLRGMWSLQRASPQ